MKLLLYKLKFAYIYTNNYNVITYILIEIFTIIKYIVINYNYSSLTILF